MIQACYKKKARTVRADIASIATGAFSMALPAVGAAVGDEVVVGGGFPFDAAGLLIM